MRMNLVKAESTGYLFAQSHLEAEYLFTSYVLIDQI